MIEKIIGYILLICVSVFVGVMCALWFISSQIEPIDKQKATRASYMPSELIVELNYGTQRTADISNLFPMSNGGYIQ